MFSGALSLCVRFFFSFLFLVSFFFGYPVSVRQQFLELLEWEEFCPANIPPHPDISHPEFCPPTFHLLRISHIWNSVRRRSTSSGYLTSGILSTDIPPPPDISHPEFYPPTFYLIRVSHIRNSVRPTFHLLRISHIRNSVYRRSTFSGYLTSGILSGQCSTFSGYLTSAILSADFPPSPDISHPPPDAGWDRRAIQLPRSDMSGSSDSVYSESVRSR